MPTVSYAFRLSALAAADPERPAITDERRTVSRGDLDRLSNQAAHEFSDLGVRAGDWVTIALPNSVEFVVAVIACWKLGVTPNPVSFVLPKRELDAIIELASPRIVIGAEPDEHPSATCLPRAWQPAEDADATPFPDAIAKPWKAMTSGGSTGRPKLILANAPGEIDPEADPLLALRRNGVHMMPGPLYHNGPFVWTVTALLVGCHVILGGRFDAENTLALIDRYEADSMYVVPTMMSRIWKLPLEVRDCYDVSSLKVVWHLAAPCPAWLKEAWIEWLGADAIWELYAGTEAQGVTIITGAEWLAHRGSVGRPAAGVMKIVRPDGTECAPGEVGEIYFHTSEDPDAKPYRYVGAEAKSLPGGWETLGDLGSFDADGYLYLADRHTDMILVGGANVYPAEIEAALDEHPQVRSSAVVGVPDDDLGNRVHAIVQVDGDVNDDDLLAFLAERLVRYKLPRSFEFVDEPLRDDAGKVRRTALRAARASERQRDARASVEASSLAGSNGRSRQVKR